MKKLKFNGKNPWFLFPENQHGLSLSPVKNITNDDFSFIAKIKVNWDEMNENNNEGGIVIKNGLHTGLSVAKSNKNECFLKGTIWTTTKNLDSSSEKEQLQNYDIYIKVNHEEDGFLKEYDVCFSYQKKEKQFAVYCNDEYFIENFEGNLLDYSNAWLWVGCCNALDNCDQNSRNFFFGEIYELAFFNRFLNKNEFKKYLQKENIYFKNLICQYDFTNMTEYKVYDISENGNHLIKYDKNWYRNNKIE